MFAVLETRRLILRPPLMADVAGFVPLIADYGVAKNLSTAPHPYTEEDGRAFVRRSGIGWYRGSDFTFAVTRKEDGAILGMCGLHPLRDWEIGYWLGRPYWGRGYAGEAARRVVGFAFDMGADRLTARRLQDNAASGRVLAKLGFVTTGETWGECRARGDRVPLYVATLERTDHMRELAA